MSMLLWVTVKGFKDLFSENISWIKCINLSPLVPSITILFIWKLETYFSCGCGLWLLFINRCESGNVSFGLHFKELCHCHIAVYESKIQAWREKCIMFLSNNSCLYHLCLILSLHFCPRAFVSEKQAKAHKQCLQTSSLAVSIFTIVIETVLACF